MSVEERLMIDDREERWKKHEKIKQLSERIGMGCVFFL
jgi:hypothetical protein